MITTLPILPLMAMLMQRLFSLASVRSKGIAAEPHIADFLAESSKTVEELAITMRNHARFLYRLKGFSTPEVFLKISPYKHFSL